MGSVQKRVSVVRFEIERPLEPLGRILGRGAEVVVPTAEAVGDAGVGGIQLPRAVQAAQRERLESSGRLRLLGPRGGELRRDTSRVPGHMVLRVQGNGGLVDSVQRVGRDRAVGRLDEDRELSQAFLGGQLDMARLVEVVLEVESDHVRGVFVAVAGGLEPRPDLVERICVPGGGPVETPTEPRPVACVDAPGEKGGPTHEPAPGVSERVVPLQGAQQIERGGAQGELTVVRRDDGLPVHSNEHAAVRA
ncbi:MAG: hypothetical protein OEY14_11680 [Myxococcales bacterium]|nr:hypothetical protein [Myxococcales bacterium]